MTPAPAALLGWTCLGLVCAATACAQEPDAGATSRRERYSDADYAAHVERLRARLPGEGFTIVLQRPFVVIGDESPERVRARAVGTVQWAVDRLRAQYFEQDPTAIIDIWLFKDRASYERGAERLFGERPSTPFGYYSPRHEALVMNIATGGGTLVHELVHPFVRANFPGCPAWFNEGLASLYEQCHDLEGRITGLVNWRLPGLQQALAAGRVPSLADLLGSGDGFYARDRGTNYAHARYLCFYLQERGLLGAFYRRFRDTAAQDPTGRQALQAVLGVDDLEEFQRGTWAPFVQALRHR